MSTSRELPLRIARYVLHTELARGGMATVFLGQIVGDGGFSRAVAIKRLHSHLAGSSESVLRFLDEARIASRVRHPNVVPMLDVVEHEGEVFLIMEFVLGRSLAELLATEVAVPLPIASAILVGALRGLDAAHSATSPNGDPLHLIHRDFSPQNLMVAADGLPRVVDFGIAKAAFRLLETETVSLRGKLAYMAPEQLNRSAVDHRADIWAAGVVLWEMLTGARLFKSDAAEATLGAVLTEAIPPVRDRRPDLPDSVDGVVARALTRDVEQRWPSAGAMADALEAAAPPATARELGAWTEGVARESLDALRASLRLVEATQLSATEGVSVRSLSAPAFSADDTCTEGVTGGTTLEPRTKRRWLASLVVPTAAVVVAVSIASAFLLRGRFGAGSGATIEPVGLVPSSSLAPSSASEPPPASAVAIDPAPAAGVPSTAVAAHPTPTNLVRRPTTRPAPSTHPPKAPLIAPPVEPAAAVVTPPPLCAVPYMVDARGIRKLKPECMR